MSEQPPKQPKSPETTPILSAEETRQINSVRATLKGQLDIISDSKSSPKDKEDARKEIKTQVDTLLTDLNISGVDLLIEVETKALNAKALKEAINAITLPETPEVVEESDENSDSSATPKAPSPAQRLEAIKSALTGNDKKREISPWLKGAGIVVVGGLAIAGGLGQKTNMERKEVKEAETATQLADQKVAIDDATQSKINNFKAGKITITNAELFNQLVPGGSFKDNEVVTLSKDQLVILNVKGITEATITEFYSTTADGNADIARRNAMMSGDFGAFIRSGSLD